MLSVANLNQGFCSKWWLWLALFITTSVFAEGAPLSEQQAKAALLYNFIKHTTWPNEQQLAHIDVVFVGQPPSYMSAFAEIAAEVQVRGKPLKMERRNSRADLSDAEVVVVSAQQFEQVPDYARRLLRTDTLLVSDSATDQKAVMINMLRSEQGKLAFEINKSNIIYEGLNISNDVLLYGGTEIEVATLYKEMERSLQSIKQDVEKASRALEASRHELKVKSQALLRQQQQMTKVAREVETKAEQLQRQRQQLGVISQQLAANEKALSATQLQLSGKEELMAGLERKIAVNESTLARQRREINQQQDTIAKASDMVERQQATIASQRNVIMACMAVLIMLMGFMLLRQKRMLNKERKLLEAEAALVRSQSSSIAAYEANIKLKNDFLTAINHELRTPMNGILGAVQFADRSRPESLVMAIDLIESSAVDMMVLVEDILTYTEIQSGDIEDQREPACVEELLLTLAEASRERCHAKGLRFECNSTVPPNTWLAIDAGKFYKVLNRLLDNAIKFTQHGRVQLNIELQHEDGECYLACQLSDTGPGIASEHLQQVMQPFWQCENGFTRNFSGLGIGLTISQKLLEKTGGEMSLNSEPGKGTSIQLRFGCSSAQAPVPKGGGQVEDSIRSILVVEDNPVNQKVMQKMLEKLGYKSVVAEDGEEALFLMDRLRFSLVLMDLQMPKMDGFTCTQEIRKRPDHYRNIPIIAVTANLMDSQAQRCIEAGMNGYLAKPVSLEKLNTAIEEGLAVTHGRD